MESIIRHSSNMKSGKARLLNPRLKNTFKIFSTNFFEDFKKILSNSIFVLELNHISFEAVLEKLFISNVSIQHSAYHASFSIGDIIKNII